MSRSPALLLALFCCWISPAIARAEPSAIQIGAALSLSGPGDYYGKPILEGARLAVEEANASHQFRAVELRVVDDQSDPDRARDIASDLCKTRVVAEIGPALTTIALTAGPAYAKCGLAAIPATAHGDDVTNAATTFQPVFNGGAMGSALASYLKFVLNGHKAVILYREDGYGQTFANGFERAAMSLSLAVTKHGFKTDAEREQIVRAAAADPDRPAIALGMVNTDGAAALIALRRQGADQIVLAPSAISGEDFAEQFADQKEEIQRKGFFTEKVYAASPMLFDSANAEVMEFAERFRLHYGRDPSWLAVQGYDSARLAIEAARRAVPDSADDKAEIGAERAVVLSYLSSLDSPAHSLAGVTGPLWFTPERKRDQPVRVGLFHNGLFDSAPIQLVPVTNPNQAELASGEVFQALPGHFVRRQRVVYTGVFVNEIPRVDVQRSTFNVDFYLWMRFAEGGGQISFDPTDIRFSGMTGGSFNHANPSESRPLPDGTVYRLWHVEGEVRNEYDLHRFPFDSQTLKLSFFNSKADADRVVYVLDRGSLAGGQQSLLRAHDSGGLGAGTRLSHAGTDSITTARAFHQLTQWDPINATERREDLVTDSPLGYPNSQGAERTRELSGFVLSVELQRRAIATALKNLLPVLIMTIIMFASLYFPQGLVKEKVTVAITAALSGAVLLTSVNNQLGSIGYTIAVEYAFYVFFGLCLLCILSVLVTERLRVASLQSGAFRVERWTKIVYIITVVMILGAASVLYA